MPLKEFTLLASAHFVALLSPGPDFFILIGNTTRFGLRTGVGTAVGIALANAAYIACVLLGFGLLSQHPLVGTLLRWLGGAYLLSIAYTFIRSGLAGGSAVEKQAQFQEKGSLGRGLSTGFLSGALNPKNGLFYLGLFSASVSNSTTGGVRCFYGLWMFLVVLGWDLLLACALRRSAVITALRRLIPKIELSAGVCLALIGFAVLVLS